MHEDEEIRYIMDGSCYFDIRGMRRLYVLRVLPSPDPTFSEHPTDSWIRLYLSAGDLIVLPAGIYHRFTVDTNDAVKAMRLFKVSLLRHCSSAGQKM